MCNLATFLNYISPDIVRLIVINKKGDIRMKEKKIAREERNQEKLANGGRHRPGTCPYRFLYG